MINYLKKILKKNHLEWRVDITSWLILIIDESSWFHGWYLTWLFRYIGYSFLWHWIICLLLKLLISLMNWFVFFSWSSSSISIDKIPEKYFPTFYFSMKLRERNIFFISSIRFSVNNPAEILCTSKLYHPEFCKINHSSLNPFFFCGVFKQQYTRHKTMGIVITYVLLFDWKNNIPGGKF